MHLGEILGAILIYTEEGVYLSEGAIFNTATYRAFYQQFFRVRLSASVCG